MQYAVFFYIFYVLVFIVLSSFFSFLVLFRTPESWTRLQGFAEGSAAEATAWISDTAVLTLAPKGIASTLGVVVTAGERQVLITSIVERE